MSCGVCIEVDCEEVCEHIKDIMEVKEQFELEDGIYNYVGKEPTKEETKKDDE